MNNDDEIISGLLDEIAELRSAGYRMAEALKYGGTKARALALAAWEQTRRGNK